MQGSSDSSFNKEQIPVEPEEDIPENATILEFAFLYPKSEANAPAIFSTNLGDVVKKTSKKPFYLKKILQGTVNIESIDWDDILEKCKIANVKAVFLVYKEKHGSF